MRVTRILHVSVNGTGVLEETWRFYAELLGLEPREWPDIPDIPGHWFQVGDASYHMVGAPDRSDGVGPRGHHVCFGVEDIAEAVAELEAAGIPFVEAGSLDVRQIWLRDPTGAAVELQPDPAVQRDRVDAAFDDNAVVR